MLQCNIIEVEASCRAVWNGIHAANAAWPPPLAFAAWPAGMAVPWPGLHGLLPRPQRPACSATFFTRYLPLSSLS
jgi:hypothetical protein